VTNSDGSKLPWDSAEDYGRRFAEINERLDRSLKSVEYRPRSEEVALLQYRLAKLAIAAEDIRRAIAVLEEHSDNDDWVADAVVELRNACTEVADSFTEVDPLLVRLLNHFSG
jgi:hypothetical protein